jgi:NAD(P)-dependent dehydrogenase (short-subunit alcohol dehydrogenase family)
VTALLDLGLQGKRVVLAGAGQGIGEACARRFAEAGAKVACIDLDADRGAAIAADVGGIALRGDVTRRDDVTRMVDEAAAAFGGVDIGVDIVGEARWGRLLDMGDEEWDQSFDLVLRHVYLLAQACGRRMVAQGTGGAFVSIASVSGLSGAPNHGPYGAAKAGLMALTKTLALELAADHVRVNAVAPGAVATPRMLAMMEEARREESAKAIPLGRHAQPADIANAVVFLTSNLADYITGQTIVVDGGATAQFSLSLRA